MIWIYITACIVLLLLIALLMPIGIKAKYDNQLYLTLTIGFVRLKLIPQKPKKKSKKSRKNQNLKKEKAQKSPKKAKTKKNLSDIIEIIKKIAFLAKNVLKDFFKHIIIKKMLLSFEIAENNAADTAITYGKCCSAVYPAVGIIAQNTNCKSYGVDISPNFDENAKSRYNIDFEAKIIFLHLAALIIKYGITGIKLMLDFKDINDSQTKGE